MIRVIFCCAIAKNVRDGAGYPEQHVHINQGHRNIHGGKKIADMLYIDVLVERPFILTASLSHFFFLDRATHP